MNWNGKPRFCPHCGNESLSPSGNESVNNSQAWNDDTYTCEVCKNAVNISYSPKDFIEVKAENYGMQDRKKEKGRKEIN